MVLPIFIMIFLLIRKPQHIGQRLKEKSYNEYKKFFRILYNIRNKYENECDNTIIYNR